MQEIGSWGQREGGKCDGSTRVERVDEALGRPGDGVLKGELWRVNILGACGVSRWSSSNLSYRPFQARPVMNRMNHSELMRTGSLMPLS